MHAEKNSYRPVRYDLFEGDDIYNLALIHTCAHFHLNCESSIIIMKINSKVLKIPFYQGIENETCSHDAFKSVNTIRFVYN